MVRYIQNRLYLLIFVTIFVTVSFTCGCSTKRPVLYPNNKLQEIGRTKAEHDISNCIELSQQAGIKSSQGGKIFEKTAKGGVKGATRVGRGAGIGAAAGSMNGFIDGFFSSRDPDPVQKRFVEECLSDKGYKLIGWQ